MRLRLGAGQHGHTADHPSCHRARAGRHRRGELCKSKKLSKLRLPQDLELAGRRKLRYSDTDLNGHVNNTRYADFACDALEMEHLGPGRFLSSMQIGYLAECRPGEELLLWTKEQDGAHFVQGMDEGGKSRFEAALIFGEVLP